MLISRKWMLLSIFCYCHDERNFSLPESLHEFFNIWKVDACHTQAMKTFIEIRVFFLLHSFQITTKGFLFYRSNHFLPPYPLLMKKVFFCVLSKESLLIMFFPIYKTNLFSFDFFLNQIFEKWKWKKVFRLLCGPWNIGF